MSDRRRIAVAVVLSIAAAAAGVAAVRRFAESPRLAVDASQRSSPPPSGAFAKGGKPAPGGPALERALATDVPDVIIALDAWARARRTDPVTLSEAEAAIAEARSRALAPDVRAELGPKAALRLEALLDAAKTAASAGGRESSDLLFEAVGAFDDALAAAGLGWFVDADVLEDASERRRLTLLYFFAVERVTIVEIGGKTVRALEVRRRDRLNWKHSLLGFTTPHVRDALVLLDQIDEQLVRGVLPGLRDDRALNLFDEDDDAPSASAARVRARAGEVVRAEYGSAPRIDAKASARLGTLLARRRTLFAGWQKLADARGLVLAPPTRLRVDLDYSGALRGLAPDAELAELRAIEDKLSAPDIERAYEALRDVLVASVRRHEVQHRLDLAGDPRKMPEPLERYVGKAFEDGAPRRHATAARDELSAYLAELARAERTPRTNLGRIARFLLQRRSWGTPESYAALVIFEGLRLDMMPARTREGPPLVVRREINREEVAKLYLALTAGDPAELRAAAGRLWERLFDASLP